MRLADGRSFREGRVEVYVNETWNTVCDDGWDLSDANVVCRMLGHPGAEAVPSPLSKFGPGTGEIILDDVDCEGSENSIFDCQHRGLFTHNCGHAEDTGAICSQSGKYIKGPLTCLSLMTSVDVYESLHHKIITC